MPNILNKLTGGNLRSIGKSDEVVSDLFQAPNLFPEVFEGLFHNNPLIRMRAADVLEKVSQKHPEYLLPFKKRLIHEASLIDQQEVRWHVALLFSYLKLEDDEVKLVMDHLSSWLDTAKSQIVKVNSLQAMADIAEKHESYREFVMKKLQEVVETGSPAVKSRGKKLIAELNKGK